MGEGSRSRITGEEKVVFELRSEIRGSRIKVADVTRASVCRLLWILLPALPDVLCGQGSG